MDVLWGHRDENVQQTSGILRIGVGDQLEDVKTDLDSLVSYWQSGFVDFEDAFGMEPARFYTQFDYYRNTLIDPKIPAASFSISLFSAFLPGSLDPKAPSDATPYAFRVAGFDLLSLSPDQVAQAFQRPSPVWGFAPIGGEVMLVNYVRPDTPPGMYTVAIILPDGRRAETTFEHRIRSTNPSPELKSLTPRRAHTGEAGLYLTVRGDNFVPGSVVHWNGAPRSTTFRAPDRMEVAISGADLLQPGTNTITVRNPPPGGGPSAGLVFVVDR